MPPASAIAALLASLTARFRVWAPPPRLSLAPSRRRRAQSQQRDASGPIEPRWPCGGFYSARVVLRCTPALAHLREPLHPPCHVQPRLDKSRAVRSALGQGERRASVSRALRLTCYGSSGANPSGHASSRASLASPSAAPASALSSASSAFASAGSNASTARSSAPVGGGGALGGGGLGGDRLLGRPHALRRQPLGGAARQRRPVEQRLEPRVVAQKLEVVRRLARPQPQQVVPAARRAALEGRPRVEAGAPRAHRLNHVHRRLRARREGVGFRGRGLGRRRAPATGGRRAAARACRTRARSDRSSVASALRSAGLRSASSAGTRPQSALRLATRVSRCRTAACAARPRCACLVSATPSEASCSADVARRRQTAR